MKKNLFCMLALVVMAGSAGCTDDPITQNQAFLGGNTVETDASWMLDNWEGGEFNVNVNPDFMHQAGIKEWSYRVIYDGETQQEETVTDGIANVKIKLPVNLSHEKRRIQTDVKMPMTIGGLPEWQPVVDMQQAAGLIELAGIYWTRGNLTVRDGKFVVATKPEDPGFLFKHGSTYGIPSDGGRYTGKAYTPEEIEITIADIPENNGDPCKLISGGDLRMPSFYEMNRLYEESFNSDMIERDEIFGQSFGGGKLFFPYSGVCEVKTGNFILKNEGAGYWHSGVNTFGSGGMLNFTKDDILLYYSDGVSMMSVRCVSNIREATYVSHTPETLEKSGAFSVTVVSDPGDMIDYKAALVDVEYDYEIKAFARDSSPEVTIEVPANEELFDVVYEIYVNDNPTGKRITHPGMTDYGYYKSHTPTGTVPADAFTLTVSCTTDMDALDVEVKADDGLSVKGVASKTNPSVQIPVPENTGRDDRVLKIYVNGKDTKLSLIQERPLAFAVIWSPGYLTVKDGAYAFAGEQELGMYFKYGSRYGLTLDSTGKKYSGTAYGPEAESKAYDDVTNEEVDPCSLVAPAGTWRMPSREEWEDMFTYDFLFLRDKYRAYTDKKQTIYITPSGSLNTTGGIANAQWAKVWSTTQHVTDATKNYSVIGTFSSETTVFNCTIGTVHNQALMVRCVKAR